MRNKLLHEGVMNQLKDAILFVHKSGEVIRSNKRAWHMLNIQEREQVFIDDFLDFHLLKNNRHKQLIMDLKKSETHLVEVTSIQLNSDIYCLILNEVSLTDQTSDIKYYIDHLIQSSIEGLMLIQDNKIVDCDTEFARMFGYSPFELKGMQIMSLITKKDVHIIQDGRDGTYTLTGLRKNKSEFCIEYTQRMYDQTKPSLRIVHVRDITEKVQAEKRMEFMANYDELTHLPNRNYFFQVLKDAIEEAKYTNEQLAVHFINLDYFKEINESFGYEFGDRLLQVCGEKLKQYLRTDTFIARMSGDEFIILQRYLDDKKAAAELVEDILSHFEKPIKLDGHNIYTSLSVGISLYPENGHTANDLIKHADSAMYVIKGKYRNYYHFFESSISHVFKKKLKMETELRHALTAQQFELHYQPQKDLRTNQVVGVEALLRWNHPIKGYIPPMDFIPLAEKTGLIVDIGDWVLKKACEQNKAWQTKGYQPITVSVNLSAKQFHQKNLVQKVQSTLHETGLDPRYLELEITESMAMTNEAFILKTMNKLRNLGVSVSIDDFGIGYSSLKTLSLYPVTKLKIDKMFMDEKLKHNKAIVRSIIKMSHSLNMKVIAEGVETSNQLNFLKRENCDEMQGFYFSKPLPPEKLPKFLT